MKKFMKGLYNIYLTVVVGLIFLVIASGCLLLSLFFWIDDLIHKTEKEKIPEDDKNTDEEDYVEYCERNFNKN